MVSSPGRPSMPKLFGDMEWKVIQSKIAFFLVWLLIISTIFLLFTLYSSNTYSITTDEGLNQSPKLNHSSVHSMLSPPFLSGQHQGTTTEKRASPPMIVGHNQNITEARKGSSTDTDGREEQCDMSAGKWVREPRGSIYTNWTCPTLPEVDNCVKHGRDPDYIYWRWKPDGCELSRFDPWMFLRIVRGKRMAFIGDSLARNQVESLLCLLSQAETPKDIYRDEKDKFRTWYFPSHEFTVMVMWTEFFVEGTRKIINGSPAYALHLDKLNTVWTEKLPGLHYAVINGGNWFFRRIYFYEGGKPIGCLLCNEANLTDLGQRFAIRRTLRAALQFISTCQECEGLVTLLRTYSPSHFEHGSWFSGGYCNRTQPLNYADISSNGTTLAFRNVQVEELERIKDRAGGKQRFELLDVTKAIMLRADGHRASLWNREKTKNWSDCLHWCLPGPIDMWNDLLLAVLKKDPSIT